MQNTNTPPSTQWEYWNGKKWNDVDTSLTLEFATISPCKLVRVAGEGDVVEKKGSALGDYRSVYISVLNIMLSKTLSFIIQKLSNNSDRVDFTL